MTSPAFIRGESVTLRPPSESALDFLVENINEWGTCEIGFWVTPDEQRNGYGTEACELLVEYAFDELRMEKVVARAFAFNDGSQALLESVGFVHEATLREHAHVGGERVDLLVYGLLAETFER